MSTLPRSMPAGGAEANLAELVAATRAGDARALQRLMARLLRPIKAAVATTLGSGHPDFDDVVQESLIRLQAALRTYRGECSPTTYARRIAAREAVRARRRTQRRRSWLLLDPLLIERATSGARGVPLFSDRLWQLVAELPAKQAQAFLLRFGFGLSLAEIGELVGAPVNTIRSRLIAARRMLQGLLSFRRVMLDA